MQSALVIAFALFVAVVSAGIPCNSEGIIVAHFADATFAVNVSATGISINDCLGANVTLRVGFNYVFNATGDFNVYYNGTVIASANSTDALLWTPTMDQLMSQNATLGLAFYYGASPAQPAGFFYISPPANINTATGTINVDLFADAACTPPAVTNFSGGRFCDPIQNMYAVQCENGTLVAYFCGNCTASSPVCDMVPQAEQPAADTCLPNDMGSGKFSCAGAPSPVASEAASPAASPAATDAASPAASPVATDAASPVATDAASPVASDAASPVASDAASPVASDAASPVASDAASPVASAAASPVASVAASPVASPVAPSPVAPSPVTPAPKSSAAEVVLAGAAVLAAIVARA